MKDKPGFKKTPEELRNEFAEAKESFLSRLPDSGKYFTLFTFRIPAKARILTGNPETDISPLDLTRINEILDTMETGLRFYNLYGGTVLVTMKSSKLEWDDVYPDVEILVALPTPGDTATTRLIMKLMNFGLGVLIRRGEVLSEVMRNPNYTGENL